MLASAFNGERAKKKGGLPSPHPLSFFVMPFVRPAGGEVEPARRAGVCGTPFVPTPSERHEAQDGSKAPLFAAAPEPRAVLSRTHGRSFIIGRPGCFECGAGRAWRGATF